ncbi:MAG TPA: hypothetical protein VF065_09795 [Ilumatobacter sp.]
MEVRREMYMAAVRLALVLSLGAVLLAVAAQSVGELSAARFVSAVAVVGLVASWMVTGRVVRAAQVVSGR